MSLSTRLTLLVLALLTLFGVAAAVAFHDSFRRSLEVDLQGRLDVRLGWLERAIDVRTDIRLGGAREPAGAARYWEVRRSDGRVLWSSPPPPGEERLVGRSRTITFHVRGGEETLTPVGEIPQGVVLAVRDHLPGFVASGARAMLESAQSVYRLEGLYEGARYEIDVDLSSSGRLRKIDARGAEERAAAGVTAARAGPGKETEGAVPGAEEVGMDLDELPEPVRATIVRVLRGIPVDDVRRTTSGGYVVYEVDAEAEGADIDLEVAPDGTLLQKEVDIEEREEELDLSEVPEPVRATVLREMGDVEVDITTRLRLGRLVYEVDAEVHGRDIELNVLEDGTVRDQHVEIERDELPGGVASAIDAALGDLPVDRVRKYASGGVVIYRIESEAGGARIELEFAPDGTPVDRDPSDVFPGYRLPAGEGDLELLLTAWASSAEMDAELARLSRSLLVVGPLALLAGGFVLALLIRWQLRPLVRMAHQASTVGPANLKKRIGPAGTSEECVKLRDAINSMVERLAEGLERERRFAGSAAHELRTPLAQLRTATEIALRSERDASQYREVLTENLDDIHRLEKLVTGLLELARRQDSGAVRGRPVSLRAIVARALRAREGVAAPGALAAADVFVSGDEDLASAALSNVLDNCSRYAPGGPPTIGLEVSPQSARLVVADRGPGVPEADRERIFEPLARLEPARPAAGWSQGFGLGLALARSTMRAFGGDLTCGGRADGDSGAEFVFTFRRASPAGESAGPG